MPQIRATVLANIVIDESLAENELPWYSPRLIQVSGVGRIDSYPNPNINIKHRVIVRAVSDTTIDLTSVSDPIYGAIDLTDSRLIAYCVRNDGSSASTIAPGSTAPYPFASSLTVMPGGVCTVACPAGQPLVSSSAKTIRIIPGSGCVVTAMFLFGEDVT